MRKFQCHKIFEMKMKIATYKGMCTYRLKLTKFKVYGKSPGIKLPLPLEQEKNPMRKGNLNFLTLLPASTCDVPPPPFAPNGPHSGIR